MMVMKTGLKESLSRYLQLKKYPNGQLAVFLENNNGFPIAELSIMNNSVDLNKNEFIFKDYAENLEISRLLLDSNLIHSTNRFIIIGSHICPICVITRYV